MCPAEFRASAFGIDWRADIELPAFDTTPGSYSDHANEVRVRRASALGPRTVLRHVNRGLVCGDGVRLDWRDEVTFDMFDGARIDYLPQSGWRGRLPDAFYSTVAAITLAWRGSLPFHASAVEMEGRAFLIAGPSGAGKSSLAADLLGDGARFVADDLTVARVRPDGGIEVLRGRPAMRQHKDTASTIHGAPPVPSVGDPRGKWLVRPDNRISETPLPLGGVIALTDAEALARSMDKLTFLAAQLFRPRWLAALPNNIPRRLQLLALAAAVPVARFPAITTFEPLNRSERLQRARALIDGMMEGSEKRSRVQS